MRRWSVRTLLCLVLGLFTTIALAWTSAGLASVYWVSRLDAWASPEFQASELIGHFEGWGAERYEFAPVGQNYNGPSDEHASFVAEETARAIASAERARAQAPTWGRLPSVRDLPKLGDLGSWAQDARGWPMIALWCEWIAPVGSPTRPRGGLPLAPSTTMGPRALPYRPIWIGLVADTALYALLWFAIPLATHACVRITRANLRLHRGLCPACGYSLSGLPPGGACPECGKAGS